MIDTIRLVLDAGEFTILEPERFQPNARLILDMEKTASGRGVIKAVLNPTKQDVARGGYAPRLTLRRRPPHITELVIEFSIPKLLYQNNFDEVTEDDFEEVIERLRNRLKDFGVLIFADIMRKASVYAIHYGKNIILPRHTLCRSIIRLIAKAPSHKWFDTDEANYRNNGHLYKIHTNNFELAFYDKMKDLEKAKQSKKRAYESDNGIQINLFEQGEVGLDAQVLRMEVRLNSRAQIQRVLKTIGLPDDDLRFFALYRKEIAQRVLLHYWERYRSALPVITMAQREEPGDLLGALIKQDPQASMGTQLQRLGAMVIVEDIGWNGLRTYMDDTPKSFERLKNCLNGLSLPDENPISDVLAIDATLQHFEPVKMEKDILTERCRV